MCVGFIDWHLCREDGADILKDGYPNLGGDRKFDLTGTPGMPAIEVEIQDT